MCYAVTICIHVHVCIVYRTYRSHTHCFAHIGGKSRTNYGHMGGASAANFAHIGGTSSAQSMYT